MNEPHRLIRFLFGRDARGRDWIISVCRRGCCVYLDFVHGSPRVPGTSVVRSRFAFVEDALRAVGEEPWAWRP